MLRSEDDLQTYRPQVSFADCKMFELIAVNPTEKSQPVTFQVFSDNYEEIERRDVDIAPCGCSVQKFDNPDGRIQSASMSGFVYMWRPVLIKYWDSSFDVFHS